MGEHLGVILGPAERFDPLGRQPVLLGPAAARYLTVRDVPNEDVEEEVLRLVLHGGASLAADEVLALEGVKVFLHLPPLEARDSCQPPGPEGFPEHGGVMEQRLLLRTEQVEPRGDDALHGLG